MRGTLWQDNKKGCQGTYTYPNEEKYVGQRLDDKIYGYGIIYNPDGRYIKGHFWYGEYTKQ